MIYKYVLTLSCYSVSFSMTQLSSDQAVTEEILSCNMSDEDFCRRIRIGKPRQRPNITISLPDNVFDEGEDTVARTFKTILCHRNVVFVACLKRNWIRSMRRLSECVDWTNYDLTREFLLNMETTKQIDTAEFEWLTAFAIEYGGEDEQSKYMWRLLEIIEKISIENGPRCIYDINMRDNMGRTPLFLECRQSYLTSDLVVYWVGLGADENTVDIHKNTLMHAIINNDNRCEDVIKELNAFNPQMMFARNSHGNTPLHSAVMRGNHLSAFSIISTLFPESLTSSVSDEDFHNLQNYLDIKNDHGRSVIEMIMQPHLFLEVNVGEIVGPRWRIYPEFFNFVKCAGLLIVCGATVSTRMSHWIEALAKTYPGIEMLQQVATLGLAGKIRDGCAVDTLGMVRRKLMMEDKSRFFPQPRQF